VFKRSASSDSREQLFTLAGRQRTEDGQQTDDGQIAFWEEYTHCESLGALFKFHDLFLLKKLIWVMLTFEIHLAPVLVGAL
jgi:hypothetical protein